MKKVKLLITMLMVLIMFSVMSVYAFAGIFDEKWDENRTGEYLGTACKINSNGEVELSKQIQKIVDENDGNASSIELNVEGTRHDIDISDEGYKQLVDLGRQIYDRESVRIKINDVGENFNVAADTEGAGQVLSGLQPLVSRIAGILLYLVVISTGLFTALDIVYITTPFFRNKVEDMKQSGQGMMVQNDKKTGQTKVRWITDEAQYAVQHCTIESGKNPLGVYLIKRLWAYIMIGIVIYILATGRVALIVNIALNLIGGLIDGLSALGK